jgi:hypothetical protein
VDAIGASNSMRVRGFIKVSVTPSPP